MSKQEQAAAKQAAAAAKFETVYAAAIAKVQSESGLRAPDPDREAWLAESTSHLPSDVFGLACSVRALREQGVAWWQIGRDLGLPGAGDSAVTGKGGAGQARRLYDLAFGAHPRTQKERKEKAAPKTEAGAARAAVKSVPREARKAAVRSGEGVLGDNLTDEQVVEMLAGRSITWMADLSGLDGMKGQFLEESADVHRKMVKVEMCGGERCVSFKEVQRSSMVPMAYREMAGPTRIVRLRSIHSVR